MNNIINSPIKSLMETREPSSYDYAIPTFTVYDRQGNKVDTLVHCFIETTLIDIDILSPVIKNINGHIYTAVYDNLVIPPDTEKFLKVIISYQKHSYGNFAVIRNNRTKRIVTVKPENKTETQRLTNATN